MTTTEHWNGWRYAKRLFPQPSGRHLRRSKKTALGLQKENFEALKQNLSHCAGIASSVLTFTDCEITALKQLPSTELEASINKVEKRSLIPCENSDIKASLQLDLYHKNLLEVFSLFDSVCPEKCNWKSVVQHVQKLWTSMHNSAYDCD